MLDEKGPSASMLAAKARVPEHVVYRPFPAETVLLNLETGKYHGLNPTGGRMLEVMEKAGTLADAATQLAREYDQPEERIQEDLCRLCAQLAERGLIEIDDAAQA